MTGFFVNWTNSMLKKILYSKHKQILSTSWSQNKRLGDKWGCKQCDENFFKIQDYRKHFITVHLKEIPEICDECGEVFKPKGLLTHKRLAHAKSKNGLILKEMDLSVAIKLFANDLHCKKCGKNFKSEKRIHNHIKNWHLHQSSFKCDICDLGTIYILQQTNSNSIESQIIVGTIKRCSFLRNSLFSYPFA